MSNTPKYDSELIQIYEWPNPACEIYSVKQGNSVRIACPEDAIAIIDSMERLLESIDHAYKSSVIGGERR